MNEAHHSAILPTLPMAHFGTVAPTMSSLEIAIICETRHNQVVETIERLFEKGVLRESRKTTRRVQPEGGGRPTEVYDLTKRDTLVVASGYDEVLRARIIDKLDELEQRQRTSLSPAEMFLQNAQAMVAFEQMQREQGAALASIGAKVDEIEQKVTILSSRPAGSEAITHIRPRIGKLFGLSEKVVNEVMRQSPYAPKPAGMVRNEDPRAEGGSYAVFWQKDVTAVFRRFADECEQVTAAMWTHPYVSGRFRLVRHGGAA